eukprot:9395483-Alexandrium_andersonii.AAC.1
MPGMRLSLVLRYICKASSSAYSCAMALRSADGAARCCTTARAPRLSEHTDAGVLRAKRSCQTRRLARTARASQR